MSKLDRRLDKLSPEQRRVFLQAANSWLDQWDRARRARDRFQLLDAEGTATLATLRVPEPGQALVVLGDVYAIAYEGGEDGQPAIYEHAFEQPKPVLAYSSTRQLHIVGGGYRVTARGIVG